MKLKIVFLISLLFVSNAFAEYNKVIGVGVSSRTEDEVGDVGKISYKDRSIFGQIEGHISNLDYQLELHFLSKVTSEGSLSVDYTRYELNPSVLWDFTPNRNWHWFLGGGIGLSQETVRSNIRGVGSDKQTADLTYSGIVQGGVHRVFFQKMFTQLAFQYFLPIAREERDNETALTLRVGYLF